MRVRSCIFALRNRLKRDRSPDLRDMRTSFLVRRVPRLFTDARWSMKDAIYCPPS